MTSSADTGSLRHSRMMPTRKMPREVHKVENDTRKVAALETLVAYLAC